MGQVTHTHTHREWSAYWYGMSHKEIVSAGDGQSVYTGVLRNGCWWVGQKAAPFTAGPPGAQVSSVRSASHRAGAFVDSHLSRAVSS